MPALLDWIIEPLAAIDQLYGELPAQGTADFVPRVTKYFEEKLEEESVISSICSIPEIPLHHLKEGQLVRFRCQVQDQYDPEYFLDTYQVLNMAGQNKTYTSLFRETLSTKGGESLVEQDASDSVSERSVCYCISLPGQNSWVDETLANQAAAPSTNGRTATAGSGKRSRDDEDCDTAMDTEQQQTNGTDDSSKRIRTSAPTSINKNDKANSTTPAPLKFNFPVPNEKGIACLVKFYGDTESMTLNTVLEVVGVISLDPSLGTVEQSSESNLEYCGSGPASQMPSSFVPRLHAVWWRPLSHCCPLLAPLASAPLPAVTRESRELLRKVLEEACLGDPLIADYVICCLLANVHTRLDTQVLGQFPLNVSGITTTLSAAGFTGRLYSLLQRLASHCHLLPLTIEHLNDKSFAPHKDYDRNELCSGVLQLPRHTVLAVDETVMSTGQLQQMGVRNIELLSTVIRDQKCKYDFQFHNIELDTNINVLVLSEGKSMLPCSTEVVLCPDHLDVEGAFAAVDDMLTDTSLHSLRTYIAATRLLQYTLPDAMQKLLQDEFVDARKDDKNVLTPETFHQQLVMARLVSMSCGESELTQSVWGSCKILETKRLQRISALNRPPPSLNQMSV